MTLCCTEVEAVLTVVKARADLKHKTVEECTVNSRWVAIFAMILMIYAQTMTYWYFVV